MAASARAELLKYTVVFNETLAGITVTVTRSAAEKNASALSIKAVVSNVSTVPAAISTIDITGWYAPPGVAGGRLGGGEVGGNGGGGLRGGAPGDWMLGGP